ncbi:PREDICTED: plexin-B2-like [Miniopterus natalensis]|uniref:plexin-B2-like n=1 Tax=Miniopterus natalensis TaxID=291302 RepID=UPI0007A72C1A|nr:PREDICTED: plexin-B2-like [Miniopterus natalensis]
MTQEIICWWLPRVPEGCEAVTLSVCLCPRHSPLPAPRGDSFLPSPALGHTALLPQAHTDSLNTLVALHQLYQYTQKYYDEIINALEEDPAAQKMQLAFRLQQIAAALENKVTDL